MTSNVKIPHTELKTHSSYSLLKEMAVRLGSCGLQQVATHQASLGRNYTEKTSSRRDEVVLHRLRLGHSYLTHSYLLKGEDASECVPCQCLLTVEHILLHCVDFSLIRPKHFSARNLNQLFNTTSPSNILNFLKEINLYKHF